MMSAHQPAGQNYGSASRLKQLGLDLCGDRTDIT